MPHDDRWRVQKEVLVIPLQNFSEIQVHQMQAATRLSDHIEPVYVQLTIA